ncbi:hypothetical protein SCH4B_4459 [Ruegeria sp. TrichCH4B]|nr:hypothetical protein SCH4B_4459 [Ruegeria sp. TrichCH4B]
MFAPLDITPIPPSKPTSEQARLCLALRGIYKKMKPCFF